MTWGIDYNICNKEKLEKYNNAIKLAMKHKSASIQSMHTEGFEHTGINNPKNISDNSLFFELESPETFHTDFKKFGYNIAKIYNLMPDNSHSIFDVDWEKEMLEEMKSLINIRFFVYMLWKCYIIAIFLIIKHYF